MKLLGILGGLGPLSSAYFYELITKHTKAQRDQDHIDMIISSRATTPDRTAFILKESEDDPLPYMIEDAKRLEAYGADAIVIPCNTAHYFIDDIRRSVSIPVPSIISETVSHVKRAGCRKIGILATEGTVSAKSYQLECERAGIEWAIPDTDTQKTVSGFIYDCVKRGKEVDRASFEAVCGKLFNAGCDRIILGCTELSLLGEKLKDDGRFVDSIEALADSAIKLFGKKTRGFPEGFANYSI